MSNNYWNYQPDNNHAAQNNGTPHSGGLLRRYSKQLPQGGPTQYAPPPAGQAPPNSPLPPVPPPQQQTWPAPQGGPAHSFFANTMQTMRRWSGKMVAARGGSVDQGPLVLYRPSAPPLPARSKPWKRSRSTRIALQMRHRRERWEKARPNSKKIWSIALTIFLVILVIAISSGAASAYAYYQSQLPRLQGLANKQVEQTTRIYDRNGQLLYEAFDNKVGRDTAVSYNYVPGVMQDAMIAAEDPTFWDNPGIDPVGIIRAASQYASSGSVESGGSTITQQLIKNLTGDTQVTLQRKLPEAALAIGLTQQYPKWKILEMYLNVSPFGAQEIGVEAAVEDFFGLKPSCDKNFKCIPAIAFLDYNQTTHKHDPLLALARASLLAGLPQSPVSYDPSLGSDHKALALQRQDYVLNQMLTHNMHINTALGDQTNDYGPITPEIIQQVEAMSKKIQIGGYHYIPHAPHFVNFVVLQLEQELGVPLFLSGLNIRTTIDADLETYVEKAVYRHLDQPELQYFLTTYPYGPLNKYHNVNDSAVVVENAKDGEILAMDGSACYSLSEQTPGCNPTDPPVAGYVNVATHPRQPGSSFKPIVYATAFQMGWYPGIVLPDRKTYFPNGQPPCGDITNIATYCPADYGGGYNNKTWPIQLDIANSFNIPAIKTLEFAQPANVLAMAERLGITSIPKSPGPSLALGAYEVSLLQMVGAYQVFADQGVRVLPQYILDIWDNYGHNLYHFDPTHPNGAQVLSPQIAYLITSMLTDEKSRSYEFEGDHVLSMWDWTLPDGTNPQVAAKTGTTDSFRDNWTIGYTPDVVVGVWSGNADDTAMDNHVVGITGAAPIWHDVIERVSGHCNDNSFPCGNIRTLFPPQPFPVPTGVIQQSVNTVNGLAGSGYTSWMLQGDVPQQSGFSTSTGTGTGNGTPTPTPTP
jgi:membrane peptidoglycan carboxypeptidase